VTQYAPGWYPNPDGPGQRYWDGQQWIDHAHGSAQSVEYRVDTLRETMFSDKIKHDALGNLLNQRAREGWQLKQVVPANVGGRVGPGGTSGLLVIFERKLG
jgi:hypothetical protein